MARFYRFLIESDGAAMIQQHPARSGLPHTCRTFRTFRTSLRSAIITAVLGGAVIAPTVAFADAQAETRAATAPAQHRPIAHSAQDGTGTGTGTSTSTSTSTGTGTGTGTESIPAGPAVPSAAATANPVFLIAGGTMAAAGAAGLTCSAIRRGRADG
ncbi:hypothetical protein [Streptomyces beihaiensis]|uniref:Uncharacterized protein n=1 Tax=Streptomyces beihaiensis TaxID=2984495 RepID=A0ABT3U637_9ACTN|nr:hypothetical protein [Streptomyces beihaiensis]MCX3064062.1 hypothetical protein [Streptomyces beihaiensis]